MLSILGIRTSPPSTSPVTSQHLLAQAQARATMGNLVEADLAYKESIQKAREEIQKNPSDPGLKDILIKVYVDYARFLQRIEQDAEQVKESYEAAIKIAKVNCAQHADDIQKKATLSKLYVQYADFLKAVHQENEAARFVEQALQLGVPFFLNSPLLTMAKGSAAYGAGAMQKMPAFQTYLADLSVTPPFFTAPTVPTAPVWDYSIVGNHKALLETRHLIWHFLPENQAQLTQKVQKELFLGAKEVLGEFIAEKVISIETIQELVTLGAIDYASFHRQITKTFLACLELDKNALLDLRLLQGFLVMLFHRPNLTQDGQFAADSVVLLKALLVPLQTIYIDQNQAQVEALLSVACALLDQMVSAAIKDLNRLEIHEPLLAALSRFKNPAHAHINWMVTYAEQAILHLPSNESFWETIARHVSPSMTGGLYLMGGVFKIIASNMASPDSAISAIIIAGLEPDRFLDALRSFQQTYDNISLRRARPWYIELRKIDLLIGVAEATGRFDLLGRYLNESPKPYEAPLLQGICDRLGRIACTVRDPSIQEEALRLLNALSQGALNWSTSTVIKDQATATLHHVALWQNQDIKEMDRVGYAPPAWHPFWTSQPQSVLLKKVQQKIQRGDILDAIPGRFTRLEQTMATGLAQIITNAEQSSTQIQTIAMHTAAIHELGLGIKQLLIASQETQRKALQQEQEPLAILGENVQEFKQAYKNILKRSGELDVLSMYVPLQGLKEGINGKEQVDLEEELEAFFQSAATVFLLLGAAGTGKSTFNRHLALKKLEQYHRLSVAHEDPPLVFFVELRSIKNPNKRVIDQFLRSKGFTAEQIKLLRAHPHQRCIFIFDGYDEINERNRRFSELDELWQWQNAKFVITSRFGPGYLNPNYQQYFRPQNTPQAFREAWMAPFSATQRSHYIKNYVEKTRVTHTVEEYEHAFSQLTLLDKEMERELERPIVLRLLFDILPEYMAAGQNLKNSTLGAVYEKYLQGLWEKGQTRVGEISLSAEEIAAKNNLAENGGFVKHGFTYIQGCALALTKANLTVAQNDEAFSHRHPEAYAAFFKNDATSRLLRFSAPLQLDQDQNYRFSHKTMQEYAVARSICAPNFKPIKPHQEDPINQLSIVKEPAILDFLMEQVKQQPLFKAHLYDWIEASKTQAALSQGAANAITVLVRAGVQFNGENLKGIQIPGADLSYGVFDHAQLQGADLRKVNLRGAWLRGLDFTGADLEGVELGEKPALEMEWTVNATCYSPDGSWLAVAAYTNIQLYDAQTLQRVHTYEGHGSIVTSIAFSPDGQWMASGCWDATVKLWHISGTRALAHTYVGHKSDVKSVAFSPDGQWIASGSEDKKIKLWSVSDTRALVHTYAGHKDKVLSVAFSHNGKWLASGSMDNTVKLWKVSGARALAHTYVGHASWVESVTFSPDGQWLASGSWDKTVKLWELSGARALAHTYVGHGQEVMSIAFSRKGKWIASGSSDHKVKLWEVLGARALAHTYIGHKSSVRSVAFSRHDEWLASGSFDKTVKLWEVSGARALAQRKVEHTSSVTSVAFSQDGKWIASSGSDQTVKLWSISAGARALVHTYAEDKKGWIGDVALSPDGKWVASGGLYGTVKLWSVSGARELAHTYQHLIVRCIAFSPDGQWVASGGDDKSLKLWNVAGARELTHTYAGHRGSVWSVAFSPDGRWVASGDDKKVRVFSLTGEGTPPYTYTGHQSRVNSLAFSPDNLWLASGSGDKTVKLWDVSATRRLVRTYAGHEREIHSVAFSPDGQWIASGSFDNTVRLWSVHSFECQAVLQSFVGPVNAVAWQTLPDGTAVLVTGGSDGALRLWRVCDDMGQIGQVLLEWTSEQTALIAEGALIENAHNLNPQNVALLKQRGAGQVQVQVQVSENITLLSEEDSNEVSSEEKGSAELSSEEDSARSSLKRNPSSSNSDSSEINRKRLR